VLEPILSLLEGAAIEGKKPESMEIIEDVDFDLEGNASSEEEVKSDPEGSSPEEVSENVSLVSLSLDKSLEVLVFLLLDANTFSGDGANTSSEVKLVSDANTSSDSSSFSNLPSLEEVRENVSLAVNTFFVDARLAEDERENLSLVVITPEPEFVLFIVEVLHGAKHS